MRPLRDAREPAGRQLLYRVGEQVEHHRFGKGVVRSCRRSGLTTYVKVAFEDGGDARTLVASIANLSRAETLEVGPASDCVSEAAIQPTRSVDASADAPTDSPCTQNRVPCVRCGALLKPAKLGRHQKFCSSSGRTPPDWTPCPDCGVVLRKENLARHRRKVHDPVPAVVERPVVPLLLAPASSVAVRPLNQM